MNYQYVIAFLLVLFSYTYSMENYYLTNHVREQMIQRKILLADIERVLDSGTPHYDPQNLNTTVYVEDEPSHPDGCLTVITSNDIAGNGKNAIITVYRNEQTKMTAKKRKAYKKAVKKQEAFDRRAELRRQSRMDYEKSTKDLHKYKGSSSYVLSLPKK